ncbi:MAG: hydrolase [Oceanospirillaceae bacterium]
MNEFKPASGLHNRHLQTLYSTLFRKCPLKNFDIEKFELSDGDFVDCYWLQKPPTNTYKPIVVLFHGLTGSFQSSYIQGMMRHLDSLGYYCVLMHFRGCALRLNRSAKAYHAGDTADAIAWAKHLREQYPNSSLFAIGYSLGANMLLNLLAQLNTNCPFKAAVAVSGPLELAVSAATLKTGFAKIYQRHLLKALKKSLLKKYAFHDYLALINLSKEQVRAFDSIEQFDDLFTAKIHGFSSAKEYYKKCSAKQYLGEISIHTLIINALDDPFMKPEALPLPSTLTNNICLETPEHGGHLGFISGSIFKPQYWLEKRISCYFEAVAVK